MEVWKDIQGYEGYYQVSNEGRVRSLERTLIRKNGSHYTVKGKIMGAFDNGTNHLVLMLWKNGEYEHYLVHVLVATAFIPNPNGYTVVHHIDHNPFNNRVENLEWIAKEEHDVLHGNIDAPKRVDRIDKITGEVMNQFQSAIEASRELNIKNGFVGISMCANGKRKSAYDSIWKYLLTSL